MRAFPIIEKKKSFIRELGGFASFEFERDKAPPYPQCRCRVQGFRYIFKAEGQLTLYSPVVA
jgi:hypothetical protein